MSPKRIWKNIVTKSVDDYWVENLRTEASRKRSLKYLDTSQLHLDKFHPPWNLTPMNSREIYKATIKAKLLLNQVELQTVISSRSGGKISALCRLRGVEAETQAHFLIDYTSLSHARIHPLSHFKNLVHTATMPKSQQPCWPMPY